MKIAFDSQIFTLQEYGGISRYIIKLADQLRNIERLDVKIITPFHVNAYLGSYSNQMISGIKVPRIPLTKKMLRLTGYWLEQRTIKKYRPDIVHETYYNIRTAAPKNVPIIITVHDMIHEIFSNMFPKHDLTSINKKSAVHRADHIICVSENTKNDLLNLLPISPDKVSVVYHGFDCFETSENYQEALYHPIKKPYLLYVGNREGYKNFENLLKAYASSHRLLKNFHIVCIGGKKINSGELQLMKKLGISSFQVEQFNANDTLLSEFYRNAAAFVYPSKYEGFGIPPLEAMSLNCPVICSNTSSIPEVVGEAAEYFDPNSCESICYAIEKVLESNDLREYLVKKGIERYKLFSWDRCSSKTLSIYNKVK